MSEGRSTLNHYSLLSPTTGVGYALDALTTSQYLTCVPPITPSTTPPQPNPTKPNITPHKRPLDLSTGGSVHSYHAQPSSSRYQASPSPHRNKRAKTRFPSLTPAPPGSFSRVSGDTRAAEAVAQARKAWVPPAIRTQAVASYGAVPDLEVQ